MRTTLNIRDDLYRDVKIRAAERGDTVTSLVEEALEKLLADREAAPRKPFVLRPLGRTGAPLAGIDMHNNAAVRDFMDEELSWEQMR